uniref:Uncharacterized protein n=1 Tax=Theropithecus gelada TaxID=9565 RepID=A0A8D2FTP7_THEGE
MSGKLTDRVLLRSFSVANVFCENSDKINRFDFSPNSEAITSSSDEDSFVLCDCQEGKPKPSSVRNKACSMIELVSGQDLKSTTMASSSSFPPTAASLVSLVHSKEW